MEGTIDAIGYKADVKSRAKESLQETRDSAKERVMSVTGVAQENPIGLALGAVAVGFVAGLLVPSTRMEDEKLGEASDQVIEKARQTGQEALEHGRQVAQETAQSAQETFKESAQQHGQEVKETAQANVQQVS
jgi:hypothetical protein